MQKKQSRTKDRKKQLPNKERIIQSMSFTCGPETRQQLIELKAIYHLSTSGYIRSLIRNAYQYEQEKQEERQRQTIRKLLDEVHTI